MFSIQSIDAANVTVRRLTGWMMAVSKARFAALVNHFGGDEQLALEAMIDDNKAPAFSQVNETFVPGEYDGVLVSNNGEGNALRVAFSADSVAFWAPGASADENPLFFDKHPHTWAGNRWVRAHAPQGLCAQSPVDAFTFMGRMPEPALSLARSSCNNVQFICIATDVVEDGTFVYNSLDEWIIAAGTVAQAINEKRCAHCIPHIPPVKIIAGIQAKNASTATAETFNQLANLAHDENTCGLFCQLDPALPEVSLDNQIQTFKQILALAKEGNLPLIVSAPNAQKQALELVINAEIAAEKVVLRVENSTFAQAKPWIEAGCVLSFGGALTYPDAQETRRIAAETPLGQLLTESAVPTEAPWPLQDATCQPDYVGYTAEALAKARNCSGLQDEEALKTALVENAFRLFK